MFARQDAILIPPNKQSDRRPTIAEDMAKTNLRNRIQVGGALIEMQ